MVSQHSMFASVWRSGSLAACISLLAAIWTVPPSASAQEASETATSDQPAAIVADDPIALEEVVVTGFRGSLQRSLDAKRLSDNVVDVISAEDVGKSTDANIAEALQRVTGVSIDRSDGEGTSVTVRGVNADLNNVTVNGVALTATGGDLRNDGGSNAVNFSQFSSDILSQIEVVKTPSADQDEGSLGASINLKTFKPLEAKKDRRAFEFQSRYAPFSDDGSYASKDFGDDYRINMSFSQKLLEETLGFSLVASTEKQGGRTDSYQIQRYTVHRPGNPVVVQGTTRLPGGFTNIETGEIITEFDYGDGRGLSPIFAHVPFEMTYNYNIFQRDRDTVATGLQWQPNDTTDVQLDVTWSQLDSDRETQRFSIRPVNNSSEGENNLFDPNTFSLVGTRRTGNGFGGGLVRNPGYVRPQGNVEDITEDNLIIGLGLEKVVDDFTFNVRAGRSRTTATDDRVIQSTFQIENQSGPAGNRRPQTFNGFATDLMREGFYSGYTCPNGIGSACSIYLSAADVAGRDQTLGPISDSAEEFSFGSFNFRDRQIEDTANSLFFDVDWDHQVGMFTSFEAGLKWSDRTKEQRQTNTNFNRFGVPALFSVPLSEFSTGETPADFGADLGIERSTLSDGFPAFDPFLALNSAEVNDPNNVPRVTPLLVNGRELSNEVLATYLKANFEMLDGQLTGDIGLRYADTSVDTLGGASVQLLTNQLTSDQRNIDFFGSQAAAEAALGRDLQSVTLPDGSPNPDFRELEAVPTEVGTSYDNLLPSLNLNYAATDDIILRFAFSKTMARPPIDQLNPRFNYQENAFNAQSSASGGNPLLKPFRSTNLDFSFEWYFMDDSILSVALFNKELDDFTRRTSELFFIRDLRDQLYGADGLALDPADFGSATNEPGFAPSIRDLLPFDEANQPANCMPNREFDLAAPNGQIPLGCDVVAFNTFVNGDGGYVRGVEMGFQHNFTYLPGFWSGFGVTTNYTYSDSETAEETEVNPDGSTSVTQLATPLPQTSLHTFNATLFYETDTWLVRLAYNRRSDYLLSANILGGYAHYREGFDTLDLSGGWDINDKLRLNFQAVNLTDTVTRDYAVFTGLGGNPNLPGEEVGLGDAPSARTVFLQNTGPIYRLGLRYQF